MKTDVYRLEQNDTHIDVVSKAVPVVVSFNGLDHKQELRLSLLCEELVGMLPNLLVYGGGEFWIENDNDEYEIHAVVKASKKLSSLERDDILAVSRSGRNAAAVGIMNRIKLAAEVFIANCEEADDNISPDMLNINNSTLSMGRNRSAIAYYHQWSLRNYKEEVKDDAEAWDELEKSIIAKMADDVTVGIMGGKVEIIVKKKF